MCGSEPLIQEGKMTHKKRSEKFLPKTGSETLHLG
jgi:hypothetical protein